MKKINVTTKYFNTFKCLAQDCPNTCCSQWKIKIDDDTYNSYTLLKDNFVEYVIENISPETNLIHLKSGYCPFLDENKLCKIQVHYGHEYLCKTCREYPRDTSKCDFITRNDLLISCPAVANTINKIKSFKEEIVLEDQKLTNKKEYIYYNNLSSIYSYLKNSKLNIKQSLIYLNDLNKNTKKISSLTKVQNNLSKKIKEKLKYKKIKNDYNTTKLIFKLIYLFYNDAPTKNKEVLYLINKFTKINFECKKTYKIYNKFLKIFNHKVNIKNFLYYINQYSILDCIKDKNLNNLLHSIFFILSIIFFSFIYFYFSPITKDYNFTTLITNVYRVCYHSVNFYSKIKNFPNFIKDKKYTLEELLLNIKI